MKNKHPILFRVSALLLVVVLLISSLSGCGVTQNGSMDENSVGYLLAKDASIPKFDRTVFHNVELCFNTYYYTDLPDNKTLANDTKAAFNEYCADVDKTDKATVTHALIDCYIYAVGDNYAFFRNPEELEDYTADMGGSFVGIGVSVLRNELEKTILVTGVEPDSPAESAGIQPDDYIIGVNGESISDIGTQELIDKIKGEVGTKVTVTVKRGEHTIDFEMLRAVITETFVNYEFIENTKIVYTRIKSFKGDDTNNTAIQFRAAVDFAEANGAEGIIFDLCSNPGGYLHLVTDMLSYLVPDNTPIVSFSNGKPTINAGNDSYTDTPFDHVLKIPSVVVVDKNSASASELFAGALRDYNDMGILCSSSVGEVTYKKGIMQSTMTFKDGSALTLTTALYNPPSGNNFHGIGVTPVVQAGENDDFTALAIAELNKLIANQNTNNAI